MGHRNGLPKSCEKSWAVLEPPVELVRWVMLGLVEIDKAKEVIPSYAGEQIKDLLHADDRADCGLRQENGLGGEHFYFSNHRFEGIAEGLGRREIISVDSDPVHVGAPGPPILKWSCSRAR